MFREHNAGILIVELDLNPLEGKYYAKSPLYHACRFNLRASLRYG
jgi:hypothetical protein